MLRWAARLLMLATLAVLAAWIGFQTWRPASTRYPLRGIDVSHHQGAIDWRRVARDGVAFAYIKATEGGDHRDRRFVENRSAARAAGLQVGAYHFFTFCRAGAEQAANFLAVAPPLPGALPPAVDLEFGGNCDRVPDGPTLRRELTAFLAPVEAAYGRPVIFYVTPEFLDAYRGDVPTRGLWRRSLFRRPVDAAPWLLWQYHNRGRVDGIDGPVDLNVFHADRMAFDAWRRGEAGRR